METKAMPSNQAMLIVDDNDDEVTQPGNTCMPTKLAPSDRRPFEETQVLTRTSSDEDYYRHLAEALDDALNIDGHANP
jgi:hypothetical protein